MNTKDIYLNIALRSGLEELKHLCYLDKNISKVFNEQHFWIKKFKRDFLPLPIPKTTLNIKVYEKMLNAKNKIADILLVNFIEKNRSITNENGLISISSYSLQASVKKIR